MPKTIQIHNVSDDLHRKLKVRAKRGVTLSDYLLEMAREAAEKPVLYELSAGCPNLRPSPSTKTLL
jgi:hypothetical protein